MIQSVARAFEILQILENEDNAGCSLGEIARRTGLKNTTAYGLINTLTTLGYVQQNDNRFYRLSERIAALGRNSQYKETLLRQIAEKPVHLLCDRLSETVILTVCRDLKRETLLTVESSQPLRVGGSGSVSDRSFFSTATGRILLSLLSLAELDQLITELSDAAKQWPEAGDRNNLLLTVLKQTKAAGFTVIRKSAQHVHAAAVPVPIKDESVRAALGVYYPAVRSTPSREKEIIEALRQTAQGIAFQFDIS